MLIVGLGNPGSEYETTRHNIGFMVVDELQLRLNANRLSSNPSFLGEVFKSKNNFLLKPQTYMNLSGESILSVKNFYKIEQTVVIHDDLDLPFGALRFKHGGGHGGHNGLKSTDTKISKEYVRIRMGIGRPEHKSQVSSYVLSDFYEEEKKHLKDWISITCDAIEFLLENTMEDTSSKYSIKKLVLQ